MPRMRSRDVRPAREAALLEVVSTRTEAARAPSPRNEEVELHRRAVSGVVHFRVVRAGRPAWNGFASADDGEAIGKVEKQAMDFVGPLLWK
jgi:hypothetical protein